jgi:hypothetical protein
LRWHHEKEKVKCKSKVFPSNGNEFSQQMSLTADEANVIGEYSGDG